jgi:hypothetical protein
MKRIIIAGLLAVSVTGCHFQTFRHSPERAASDANVFLKALYIDHDYQRALDLADAELRKAATVENLQQMVEIGDNKLGKIKELRAESYLRTQGRSMDLFYVGDYERGVLYHHIVMAGDASAGYRVSGVWFKDDPYPEGPLRLRFERNLVVR